MPHIFASAHNDKRFLCAAVHRVAVRTQENGPPKRFQTFRSVVHEGTILPELLSQKIVSKFQTARAPCDGQSRAG